MFIPRGSIEPHSSLLTAPPAGQLIYKIMSAENALRSVAGAYLHFNRADSYKDFPGADPHDGEQLPADQPGNTGVAFEKAPNFTAADYYIRARERTYACCFSLTNSDYIWTQYGSGSLKGKVCFVFDFDGLRNRLNRSLDPDKARLVCGDGITCHQMFDVNYGVVEYVERAYFRANDKHLPNPIRYAFLKDLAFKQEQELRVTLSALGIGHFVLNNGGKLEFSNSLQALFDFRAAISEGTIREILCAPESGGDYFRTELAKLGIHPAS